MSTKLRGLAPWWLVPVLSAASFAATSTNPSQLADAAQKRDKGAAGSLLRQHVNVNAPQGDGATALAWAAYWDDLEIADLLIRAGANVRTPNDLGVTPLSLACGNGSAAMVEKLLKAGADAGAASQRTGETALMRCALTGNIDAVKGLLACGADVNARETRAGQSVLMWAVVGKHPEVVRTLVEQGADVHARSNGAFTPLLFAAQQGDIESARILLAAGASTNEATSDGLNVLLTAAASGQEAFAVFMLDKGADPNATDEGGMTALHYALLKGFTEIRGCCFQPWTAPKYRPNLPELVKALLAHGANPNAQILRTPLKYLGSAGRMRIGTLGATPFLLAAATYDVGIMRMLVAGGADPLLATKEKNTPLMVAAGLGRYEARTDQEHSRALEAVKLAVELGADVNAANEAGQTPLHGAAYMGTDAIIQFLV